MISDEVVQRIRRYRSEGVSLREISRATGISVNTIRRYLADPMLGICQDTSKKLVRSLFIPEEPQQGLCPYASLPQDIFLT